MRKWWHITRVHFNGFFGIYALVFGCSMSFWPCFICWHVYFGLASFVAVCISSAFISDTCHTEIESAFISSLTNCVSFLSSLLRFAFFLPHCLCFFFIFKPKFTFLFSTIILRFWFFLFSFCFVDFGFSCGDFVWHTCISKVSFYLNIHIYILWGMTTFRACARFI